MCPRHNSPSLPCARSWLLPSLYVLPCHARATTSRTSVVGQDRPIQYGVRRQAYKNRRPLLEFPPRDALRRIRKRGAHREMTEGTPIQLRLGAKPRTEVVLAVTVMTKLRTRAARERGS